MELLLIGALIGFLSAVGKDLILEKSKNITRRKEFKREKLEEVFIISSEVTRYVIIPVEFRDKKKELNSSKLSMIINLYFPQLRESHKDFSNAYTKLEQDNIKKIDNQKSLDKFYNEYLKFKDKIIKESENLI